MASFRMDMDGAILVAWQAYCYTFDTLKFLFPPIMINYLTPLSLSTPCSKWQSLPIELTVIIVRHHINNKFHDRRALETIGCGYSYTHLEKLQYSHAIEEWQHRSARLEYIETVSSLATGNKLIAHEIVGEAEKHYTIFKEDLNALYKKILRDRQTLSLRSVRDIHMVVEVYHRAKLFADLIADLKT